MKVATKVRVRIEKVMRETDKAILLLLSRVDGAGFSEEEFWVPKSCFTPISEHVGILTFNAWFRQIHSDFWLKIEEAK